MRASRQEIEALAEFRFTLRRFLSFSEEAAMSKDLTSLQWQALLAIEASDQHRLESGALAKSLLVSAQSAAQLIDRLELLGFAERSGSEADRRNVVVTLSEKGRHLVQELAGRHLAQLVKRRKQLVEVVRIVNRVASERRKSVNGN